MYSKLIATGSYLPKKILTNTDFEKIIDTSDDWITTRTGIKARHIADQYETTHYMGAQAAKNCLKMAKIDDANSIELIIVGTTTSVKAFPSTACLIQKKLAIQNCIAFDVAAACSGFIYALSVADQFIKSGQIKKALVIGAESYFQTMDPEDRSTLVLFGDGAGAVLLSADNKPGVIAHHLNANTHNAESLVLPNIDRKNTAIHQNKYMHMKGNEVFKIAVKELANLVSTILTNAQIEKEEIDWLVPHQANLRIISATAKKLDLDISKVVITLDKHGNCGAASIPLALDEAVRDGRIKAGQLVLLEAFGGGFTWGASLVRF